MRLIYTDALLNAIDPMYKAKKDIVPDNFAEGCMQMEKLIKLQPTAYDVDKVVEALKNKQDHHKALAEYERQVGTVIERKEHEYAVRVLSEAIEIVKRGGIDE